MAMVSAESTTRTKASGTPERYRRRRAARSPSNLEGISEVLVRASSDNIGHGTVGVNAPRRRVATHGNAPLLEIPGDSEVTCRMVVVLRDVPFLSDAAGSRELVPRFRTG
ncbi:MAG: hypothetical protein QM784_33755 [Polyangiaceae bacterium]